MRLKSSNLLILLFLSFSISVVSQEDSWFYIKAKDTLFQPKFENDKGLLSYQGDDHILKEIFEKYQIKEFKKTYKKAKKEDLKKTFFVISDRKELCYELLKNASH